MLNRMTECLTVLEAQNLQIDQFDIARKPQSLNSVCPKLWNARSCNMLERTRTVFPSPRCWSMNIVKNQAGIKSELETGRIQLSELAQQEDATLSVGVFPCPQVCLSVCVCMFVHLLPSVLNAWSWLMGDFLGCVLLLSNVDHLSQSC